MNPAVVIACVCAAAFVIVTIASLVYADREERRHDARQKAVRQYPEWALTESIRARYDAIAELRGLTKDYEREKLASLVDQECKLRLEADAEAKASEGGANAVYGPAPGASGMQNVAPGRRR